MVKRTTTSIRTHLPSVALFLILLFVLIQVMPRALGQSSDRGSDEALAIHQQGGDRSRSFDAAGYNEQKDFRG